MDRQFFNKKDLLVSITFSLSLGITYDIWSRTDAFNQVYLNGPDIFFYLLRIPRLVVASFVAVFFGNSIITWLMALVSGYIIWVVPFYLLAWIIRLIKPGTTVVWRNAIQAIFIVIIIGSILFNIGSEKVADIGGKASPSAISDLERCLRGEDEVFEYQDSCIYWKVRDQRTALDGLELCDALSQTEKIKKPTQYIGAQALTHQEYCWVAVHEEASVNLLPETTHGYTPETYSYRAKSFAVDHFEGLSAPDSLFVYQNFDETLQFEEREEKKTVVSSLMCEEVGRRYSASTKARCLEVLNLEYPYNRFRGSAYGYYKDLAEREKDPSHCDNIKESETLEGREYLAQWLRKYCVDAANQ